MVPYDTGTLIRCDCGHSASRHNEDGCAGDGEPCPCRKPAATIVMEEIAALRPEWIYGSKPAGRTV